MSGDPYARWVKLSDDTITEDKIRTLLQPLASDLWVAAACADRVLNGTALQRVLLDLGLARTQGALDRCRNSFDVEGDDDRKQQSLRDYLAAAPEDAQLLSIRTILRTRLARLDTFIAFSAVIPEDQDSLEDIEEEGSDIDQDGLGGEEWEDDPWGNDGASSDQPQAESKAEPPRRPGVSPVALSQFLLDALVESACVLAATECLDALRVVKSNHALELWPFRLRILEAIPEHVPPSNYYDLLPTYDVNSEKEPFSLSPSEPIWEDGYIVRALLPPQEEPPHHHDPDPEPLDGFALSGWYLAAAERVVSFTGMPDPALELLQYGAGQGIPGLDEAGEDLSLLSRLVYDAPSPSKGSLEDWSLQRWRALGPNEVVHAYLKHVNPENVVASIRSLALPYLYVLEARAERAGAPDPELPKRALETYILNAPLELAAAIFEASKPTLAAPQRLIKSAEECVRLALATLYGSDRRDAWGVMSAIFECLPAWDVEDEDDSSAATTLASLGAFVAPTTARARATPEELLLFFKPLPTAALSRALDVLDVQLESGEILARWGVPAPLRWFLQSHEDVSAQRSWATRMARSASGLGEAVDTQEEWESLLDDMLKLSRHGSSGLRGAFGLLERDEIIRIFFSGLLSAGDFDIARVLLHKTKSKLSLAPSAVEDICLACSTEFYDNASSGNYKVGDMKLAYDCLSIPTPSERLIREKEFIEATSRIASFNVTSTRGLPISPIEIRLTQDKLSLVARVLRATPDACKHVDMLLDLAHKLGFHGDVSADASVMSMAASAALQAEDFALAHDICTRLVDQVTALPSSTVDEPQNAKARTVAWEACFQLGRQAEYGDHEKKMALLGRALELCPPEQIYSVLNVWRQVDDEARAARGTGPQERRGRSRKARKQADLDDLVSPLFTTAAGTLGAGASSLAARLQSLRANASVPASPLANVPDAAAIANRALGRVAGALSFMDVRRDRSMDSVRSSGSRDGPISRPGSAAPGQASRALQKGIGWLIGADE